MRYSCIIILIYFFFTGGNSWAQQTQLDSIDHKKLNRTLFIEAGLYSGTMVGLGTIWYQGNLEREFNFFNDNQQWKGLDKAGHLFSAYQLSAVNARLFMQTGVRPKKAYLYSALTSTAMMLSIEVFDGFSPSYGASTGDLIANTVGAFLPFQELLWNTVYIHPKFSFHQTKYADIRPDVLGHNMAEQWLKDYNGQTYWISTNFNLFSANDVFPSWLAFSIGYGAEAMLYGNSAENKENGYSGQRQYYLSLDFDLSKIETNKKWLKVILFGLNTLKIPFPTVEFNQKGMNFHPLYF